MVDRNENETKQFVGGYGVDTEAAERDSNVVAILTNAIKQLAAENGTTLSDDVLGSAVSNGLFDYITTDQASRKSDSTLTEADIAAIVEKVGDYMPKEHQPLMGKIAHMPSMRQAVAALTGVTLALAVQSCQKERGDSHYTKPDPVSYLKVGEKGVYYDMPNSITGAAADSAKKYSDVYTQPGYMNSTYGFGPFDKNAVGYMSGIALVSGSLSTSASTFVPPLSVLDLEGRINALPAGPNGAGGWLRDAAGNKVATTFSVGNANPAYLMDLRREDVQDHVVAYALQISKNNPRSLIIDEPDQASYYNATYPGLQPAFGDMYRRVAWSVYFGYPLSDEFKRDATGAYIRDGAGKRVSNIERVTGADGIIRAQNIEASRDATGAITRPAKTPWQPTGKFTVPFSGIQPTPDNNIVSDHMLETIAWSGCEMTLESRVYTVAGLKTDAAYRAAVTERLMKLGDYALAAGRKTIRLNFYEPAETNSSAGYEAAGVETAKFMDDLRRLYEAKGLKLHGHIIIGSTGQGGFFRNNDPLDFIENRKLKQSLKNNPTLQSLGIDVTYVKPMEFDKTIDERQGIVGSDDHIYARGRDGKDAVRFDKFVDRENAKKEEAAKNAENGTQIG